MRICLALLGTALLLTACNTIHGVGEDVSSVGQTVSDAAK